MDGTSTGEKNVAENGMYGNGYGIGCG